MQCEEIDLTDRAPVRAHLRVDARRQGDLAQPLQDPLPIPVIVRFVVENQFYIGQSEERKRTQMHHMWNSVHDDFERNRDLLFDLLRRDSRPLRNDLDVVIRHVRIGLDGKVMKRNHPSREKQQRKTQHEQTVVESKINDSANHSLLPFIAPIYCSSVFCSTSAFETT